MPAKPGKKPAAQRRSVPSATPAMLERVRQRIAATGGLRIPAVPSLVESYVEICSRFFSATGRRFAADEVDRARSILASTLSASFAASPRSKIVVSFQADPGCPLGYSVEEDVSTVADAYERWIGTSNAPLFGANPDARVLHVATHLGEPATCPVLDLGAGTGRNAFALARRGFPVDAVELTPKFADIIAEQSTREGLGVRVIAQDIFKAKDALRPDYRFFFASEVVPDFRSVSDLRQLFEVAAQVLAEGGILLFNIHLAAAGFTPDKASREFAQQSYSALFTASEIREAITGLPFELLANDSVYRYELDNLPREAFPPTPWFVNWVSGLDVYEIESDKCPVELRWLTFRRTENATASASFDALMTASRFEAGSPDKSNRPRRFDATQLRAALVRRLKRRAVASGTLTLPAVPALSSFYTSLCLDVFGSLGRALTQEQRAELTRHLDQGLYQAFESSARSNINVTYEISMGSEVHYTVTSAPVSVAEAYEDWHDSRADLLFGTNPDARVRALVERASLPTPLYVLDAGAGTGRHALWLASLGHRVDAMDIAPKFVTMLDDVASRRGLPLRAIRGDILSNSDQLAQGYSIVVASGLVGDLRGQSGLRRFLEVASSRLVSGGKLLMNVHLAASGYTPEAAVRQWAEQCCATFFTRSEFDHELSGLPLKITDVTRAYEYERNHLAEEDWPPTDTFPEWSLCQHMFALAPGQSPIELWWLELTRD